MSAQPEALRLADELKTKGDALGCSFDRHSAELRRLHAALERETASRQAAQIENEALLRDAQRYRKLKSTALLGFRGAPSWSAVLSVPVVDAAHTTLDQIVDAIRARGAAPKQPEGEKP